MRPEYLCPWLPGYDKRCYSGVRSGKGQVKVKINMLDNGSFSDRQKLTT